MYRLCILFGLWFCIMVPVPARPLLDQTAEVQPSGPPGPGQIRLHPVQQEQNDHHAKLCQARDLPPYIVIFKTAHAASTTASSLRDNKGNE